MFIDGQRAGVTPFESGDLKPGKHRYVAMLPGHADARGEFEIVKDKPFTLNIALASAFGDIVVDAPKGATVESNGAAVGVAPFKGRLAEGSHKVAVSMKGYKPFAASAKITAGQKTEIAARLEKLGFGAIRFAASPWADIYMNNEKVGATPKVVENIPEGQVTVKLVNPAYKPFSQTVKVAPNETAAVSHAFTDTELEAAEGTAAAPARTGSLNITSTPAGQVFVDGKAYGETPKLITELAAGPHMVIIRRPGLSDYKREITVIEDFTMRLAVE
ncbi:MAG: PEGA domain-containing protein [Nitrospinae bacterium]|nr:PEGA domain-containing protein [Nitrospinota bacterium]